MERKGNISWALTSASICSSSIGFFWCLLIWHSLKGAALQGNPNQHHQQGTHWLGFSSFDLQVSDSKKTCVGSISGVSILVLSVVAFGTLLPLWHSSSLGADAYHELLTPGDPLDRSELNHFHLLVAPTDECNFVAWCRTFF